MISERGTVYFIGTAGAGKTSLVAAYNAWLKKQGITTAIVNLDPGAETLPYEPDWDIRERIILTDLMIEHGLGPNGAQILAADLIATQLNSIREEVQEMRADVVLVDTPGQLELFVFRMAGKFIVEGLDPDKTVLCYCIDPYLTRTAGAFASQLLLAVNTQVRFSNPMTMVLTKADRVEEDALRMIQNWAEDLGALENDILQDSPNISTELAFHMTSMMRELNFDQTLIAASSVEGWGLEEIYRIVQGAVGESEDASPEYDTHLRPGQDDIDLTGEIDDSN